MMIVASSLGIRIDRLIERIPHFNMILFLMFRTTVSLLTHNNSVRLSLLVWIDDWCLLVAAVAGQTNVSTDGRYAV